MHGPQHQVKPAASSYVKCGSRAAEFTAKATSAVRNSDAAGTAGPAGVWGAARAQGSRRNVRDPSAQPKSGQGRSYKPQAKADGAPCAAMRSTAAQGSATVSAWSRAETELTQENLSDQFAA